MTARTAALGRVEPIRAAADATAGTAVFVRGIEVMASIGVHPHEMETRQRVLVDVDLDLGDLPPPADDRLAETIDYQEIARHVESLARGEHVQLVETLAERIAAWCLEDERVVAATVRVEKPEALHNAAGAGCVITRRRA
jgi:dihydroneopterin aldolase